MGEIRDTGCESGSDIICLEGNGARPSHSGAGFKVGGAMYTLNTIEVHSVAYIVLEHHPSDSRIRVVDDDICQSLSARMGTGGGNVPLILSVYDNVRSNNKRQR